jgi:uncharacterized membrane protein YedE/YeeE
MPIFASLVCGFVFGCGLTVSGMIQPAKVLGFLDVFGAWDPSLAVVMAAGLTVTSIGYALVRRRSPLFEKESLWPTKKDIDQSLLLGALLFGIGWGLVGLCPGPAVTNLATLSLPVIIFVIAMALGMLAHDLMLARRCPLRIVSPAQPPQMAKLQSTRRHRLECSGMSAFGTKRTFHD